MNDVEVCSRAMIATLEKITGQIGPPVALIWAAAPYGTTVAIARFRHSGVALDLSPSKSFRLIFHLSESVVETGPAERRRILRVGEIATSIATHQEQIRIRNVADTLHFIFSPHLTESLPGTAASSPLPRSVPVLRAAAVQALVGLNRIGTPEPTERAVHSVVREVQQSHPQGQSSGWSYAPCPQCSARAAFRTCAGGVSVPELAEAAGLSLYHFIKVCRHTEGFTPHKLLLNMRVERAIAILTQKDSRMDETAIATGFSSPSHFVCTFGRFVGVLPSEFRSAVSAVTG